MPHACNARPSFLDVPGHGTTTSCASIPRPAYSYVAISRPTGLAHDLVTGGSANDASLPLAYDNRPALLAFVSVFLPSVLGGLGWLSLV